MYTLKKSLGQHFLHDENMCRKIVAQLHHQPGMRLLEVGPGGGALTKYLLGWSDIAYKAIEIDQEKVEHLYQAFSGIDDKIIQADILKVGMPFDESFSIIGNFPYNISSPILFRILEWEPMVQEVIGMFQKEVAQRIAASEGSKVYGILSVLVQAYFKVEYLFDVHENCFTPPPKVKSGVLRLTNLHDPYNISDRRKFTNLVKTAFGQRRKTLRNALKGLERHGVVDEKTLDKRAEQLSVADFVALYQQYDPAQ
jgi:16S rRNA (adenine1518-N6/adenine1519-N6)-dimethyltransferase